MPRSPVLLFAVFGSAALVAACGSSNSTGATAGTGATGSTSSTGGKRLEHRDHRDRRQEHVEHGRGEHGRHGRYGRQPDDGRDGRQPDDGHRDRRQRRRRRRVLPGDVRAEQHGGVPEVRGQQLQYCGCKASMACASQCTAECADPTTLTQTSPCGQCLLGQAAMGMGSSCTVSGYIAKCLSDPDCSAFANCGMACP